MTRESRHLKICGFSDSVNEQTLMDHFTCYGRVQKIEFLKEEANSAVVSFMDLRTAANAIGASHEIRGHTIKVAYYEPGGSTLNAVVQYHESSEALHGSNGQHRRNAFSGTGQQGYQRSAGRNQQTWFSSSGGGEQRGAAGRHGDDHSNVAGSIVRSNTSTSNRTHSSRNNNVDQHKRPSSRLSSGHNNRRGSASSASSGNGSASRSRSRSSSSRSPSASSRGSRTVGSSRYSVDSRGRHLGNGEHRMNSKDGDAPSGSYKNASILVRNLPLRSTDSSLKDGLFFTYKKHGKVVSVKVVGEGPERYAVVTFRRSADTQKAIESTNNVMFFGSKINVEIAPAGLDVDDNERRPLEKDIDQYHPKSSRTLYVGNLENRITPEQLRVFFERFGDVVDVDIKNRETPAPFAFVQFTDIVSVVKAIHAMEQDGYIGNNKIKVGFGKPLPSPMVWIDELPEHVSSEYLSRKMNFYGSITDILIDKVLHQALITYDCIEAAQSAVQDMKGRTICNRKVQIDFCSRELHDLFVDRMFRTNQLRGREAIYFAESILPSSASQRLSMSRSGNSYEVGEFYSVDNYYEPSSSTAKSFTPANNNRRSVGTDSKARSNQFDERQPYEYGENGGYDEYESSNRECSRSQEQHNQRKNYRNKGRSLTPPQTVRHSSNRVHHDDGTALGLNAQRLHDSTERASQKRPRSPGLRAAADLASKKRSSSTDRSDPRLNRQESKDHYARETFVSGTIVPTTPTSSTVVPKKPRTPPSPRNPKSSTSSSNGSSTSVGNASSNDDSSSSSSSEESSSESEHLDSVDKDVKKEQLEPAAANSSATANTQHMQFFRVNDFAPSTAAAPATNLVISLKDPSPEIQKLQRERAQLLQMLETLDGEEDVDVAGVNAVASSTIGAAKKSGDKKTSTMLSQYFDISWMGKLAAAQKKKQSSCSDTSKVSNPPDDGQQVLTSYASECNPQQEAVEGKCQSISLEHLSPGTGNLFSEEPTRECVDVFSYESSTSADRTQNFRHSSILSLKSNLTISQDEECLDKPLSESESTLRPKYHVNKTIKHSPEYSPQSSSLAMEEFHSPSKIVNIKADPDAASTSTARAYISSNAALSGSNPKNEAATPARASLSHAKCRRIPLETLVGAEQPIDPRTNPPKIAICVDLPIPHFSTKKPNVASVSSATNQLPFKQNRPDLKIETQATHQANLHTQLQTRSSSGSDLSPLGNGGDASTSSDALMSPPSAGSACWAPSATDIFGESLSPVTPVSGESRASFEERIKALDVKFKALDDKMKMTKERPTLVRQTANIDYSKYRVVKKPNTPSPVALTPQPRSTTTVLGSSAPSTSCVGFDTKNAFFPTKTSVFDQDSQRLAIVEEKYTPISIPNSIESIKVKAEEPFAAPPLTINIPPSVSTTSLTSSMPQTTLTSAVTPTVLSAAIGNPLSPSGPLQGILKNKPKTPTSTTTAVDPLSILLPPTTPITPVTPQDSRMQTLAQPPLSLAPTPLVDPRSQRKDSLKSPTGENLSRYTIPTVKPVDPRQIQRTPSTSNANFQRQTSSMTAASIDGRNRILSTASLSGNSDPRLSNRPPLMQNKQDKLSFVSKSLDAKISESSSSVTGHKPTKSLDSGHSKELRNKDFDDLFKNKYNVGDSSDQNNADSSSVAKITANQLPKIKKKVSATGSEKTASMKSEDNSADRRKDSKYQVTPSKESGKDKEKRKEKNNNQEKIEKLKEREKLKSKILKEKFANDDERRKFLKEARRRQESKENSSSKSSSTSKVGKEKSAKQLREEKLKKLINKKRLKSGGGGDAKSSDDGKSNGSDSYSGSESESEKRAAKDIEKDWHQILEALGDDAADLFNGQCTMYDRVKRRSSATYTDPWKSKSNKDKFNRLKKQRSGMKNSHKGHRRVQCSDDSSSDNEDTDGGASDSSDDSDEPVTEDQEKMEKTKKPSNDEEKCFKKHEKAELKKKKKEKEKLSINDVWTDESSSDDDDATSKKAVETTTIKERSDSEKEEKRKVGKEEKKLKKSKELSASTSVEEKRPKEKSVEEKHKKQLYHNNDGSPKVHVSTDRGTAKEKSDQSLPQKRGPGRPKKNRESDEMPNKKKDVDEAKKDKEKKKHKLKRNRDSSLSNDSTSAKKKLKQLRAASSKTDEKEVAKKRKLFDTSSSEVEQPKEAAKKTKLDICSPNSSSNSSTGFPVAASAFVTKAAKKQVDLSPQVEAVSQPPFVTKAAKKAVDFTSVEKSVSEEKLKHGDDSQAGAIQTLDNAEISADIVAALKRSIGEPDDFITEGDRLVELSVQEEVVTEIEQGVQESASREGAKLVDALESVENVPSTSDSASIDVVDTSSIECVAPASSLLEGITVKVDELGENLHQDLAEQKSDVSSHVDEIIDDVVHGYVEIEPEKLKEMANDNLRQSASATAEDLTKISPVNANVERTSLSASIEAENVQVKISSVENLQTNLPFANQPKSADIAGINVKVENQAAEGLLATAQQQQDLMMRQYQTRPVQQQQPMNSSVDRTISVNNTQPTVGSQAVSSFIIPSMISVSQQMSGVPNTPPSQQPSFLATSTPMSQMSSAPMSQMSNVASQYGIASRVPASSAVNVPIPYAAALYDMQLNQGLLPPNMLIPPTAAAVRFPPGGAMSLESAEIQMREQQRRFMAEQQRQAAEAAASQQIQRFSTSKAANPLVAAANYSNIVAGLVPPPQQQHTSSSAANEALMNHRWLLERYPVIWQGYLALKNDNALVQMHLVSGNAQLLPHSLPLANEASPIPVLRIMQRMRLEPQQLDGVGRRMLLKDEHCVLVVLPCGQDRNHIIEQSTILNTAFITYLQQKQAAGIVNITPPGASQPAYVVHIFPPCEFAQQSLMETAGDFLQSIVQRQTSFLFVVVTTVQGA